MLGINLQKSSSLPPKGPAQPQLLKTIVGIRSSQGGLKIGASGVKTVCAFATKLKKATSEIELKEFLDESGLTGVEVRKLEPLQKWHENHEAFRVVVAYKHKDVLLSPDFWPFNVEVREWVYKSKVTSATT